MSISTIIASSKLRQNQLVLLGITLIAMISLSIAYFVEYVLGFAPCPLCLYQRFPYFVLIILGIIGVFIERKNPIFLGIILTISSSIILAGYHTGVERGIFAPSDSCKGEVQISAADAMKLLYDQPIATCTKPPFKVVGLSMTEWNLLYNLFLLVILITYYKLNIKQNNE
jgi:disulfide bond formation protein DsbB